LEGHRCYDNNVSHEIDLTRPFIAIRQDEDDRDYDPTMGEYLCNPLDDDLLDVDVSTGGFYSDDELGVIEGTGSLKPSFFVPAGGAVRFALSTREEYAEMAVHWRVRYRTATRGVERGGFGTFKRRQDTVFFPDVPVLGGPGEVVPRST